MGLHWNCDKSGCLIKAKMINFDVLNDCLPKGFGLTDVDGIVEVNGKGLMIEWKSKSFIPKGQKIMFKKLTKNGLLTVIVVVGDAKNMTVKEYCNFSYGIQSKWNKNNLVVLKDRIRYWVRNGF